MERILFPGCLWDSGEWKEKNITEGQVKNTGGHDR